MDQTAARELREETGAEVFSLRPVCVYSVVRDDGESFGGLYYGEVSSFGGSSASLTRFFSLGSDSSPRHFFRIN